MDRGPAEPRAGGGRRGEGGTRPGWAALPLQGTGWRARPRRWSPPSTPPALAFASKWMVPCTGPSPFSTQTAFVAMTRGKGSPARTARDTPTKQRRKRRRTHADAKPRPARRRTFIGLDRRAPPTLALNQSPTALSARSPATGRPRGALTDRGAEPKGGVRSPSLKSCWPPLPCCCVKTRSKTWMRGEKKKKKTPPSLSPRTGVICGLQYAKVGQGRGTP